MRRNTTKYVFEASEAQLDWDAFNKFMAAEKKINNNDWVLDLSKVEVIDSLSIGNLIAVNGVISQGGSRVTVAVRKGTNTERVLISAKLDRIMDIKTSVPGN